jgi:uncharacterized protein (TIGR02453 family)
MGFMGLGTGIQRFYRDLAAHNERQWFTANQERYENEVLMPALSLVAELGPRFEAVFPDIHYGLERNGSGSVMRIHRDVRFSPDKRPYKENLGVVFWLGEGKKVERPCLYLNVEKDSAFLYAGRHRFPKGEVGSYRAAVADPTTGTALERILSRLAKAGLAVLEEAAYKKVPRDFPSDHPRERLLRHDGLGVFRPLTAEGLASPGLPGDFVAFAKKAKPLLDWLCAL